MKKCLIVVDYQNDFVSGSLGFPGAERIDGKIAEKIRQYRAQGDDVVFTLDTHKEDYLHTQEGKNLPVPHCIQNTEGHKLYGLTAESAEENDRFFCKPTFGSDSLFAYLKETPYEEIELVGVVTNICVISNAVLAKTAQPETLITVDAACVGSNSAALGEAALDVMESFQIRVINRTKGNA